jgi:hypothetical protein
MEHIWSRAVATAGKRWQMGRARKRLKPAKTVAVGCHRLPEKFHGKEGVSGSSPEEGFAKAQRVAGAGELHQLVRRGVLGYVPSLE